MAELTQRQPPFECVFGMKASPNMGKSPPDGDAGTSPLNPQINRRPNSQARIASENLDLRLLDVFCGMGGWSIGFHRENFGCQGIDTVDVGYPYELILSDVKQYHPEASRFQVVVESPPCTEFSQLTILSWKKGLRGRPEPKKGVALVKEGLRVIQEAKPKYWLIENVRGSVKHLSPFLGAPRVVCGPWVLWGNFPKPDLPVPLPRVSQKSIGVHPGAKTTLGKGGNKIGLPEDFPFDPLRSWKRARIPVFLAQKVAATCRGSLLEAQTG